MEINAQTPFLLIVDCLRLNKMFDVRNVFSDTYLLISSSSCSWEGSLK